MTGIPKTAEIIAMAGKGGTGKTTMSALLIRYLLKRRLTPVLAVDADANANLNELLGIPVEVTMGDIRDRMKTETPVGMTKSDFMEMEFNKALIESEGFDLLVMGQPQGPGCYCMANSILAGLMERLSSSYRYMLVDNEAGMEHLSRFNLRKIGLLFVVSDASARGVTAARRIADLTKSLGVEVNKKILIVNRAPEEIPPALDSHIKESVAGSDLIFGGYVHASPEIFAYETSQRSLLTLSDDVRAVQEAEAVFERML